MGLLEEAIREHLELKRKHGASDEELLQEEADALGPARREELAVDDAEPEPEGDGAVAEEELAYEEPPAAPPEADVEQPTELERPIEAMPAEEPRLEESPDFSQTPEQDGLGSEQKPPRDFDFD
jgi:hypothetical protein